MRELFYSLCFAVILVSCDQGKFEKADPMMNVGVEDTVAIYWKPLDYDSILVSIHEHFTFKGDDTLDYLPRDRELYLSIEYAGKLKEYMNHGKLVLTPFEASCTIQNINDTLFLLKPRKNASDSVISMYYNLTFNEPYYFTYFFDNRNITVNPKDTVMMFMRSR